HGVIDAEDPRRSALLLAQDGLPIPLEQAQAGKRVYEGRLTVADILADWQLDAELVTFSGCQTALGREGGGDGFVGFTQALLLAGARSLVVSLWHVEDTATALLMVRFYENWLKRGQAKAEALREAKAWLRGLSAEEAGRAAAQLPRGGVLVPLPPGGAAGKPVAHPRYRAALGLVGDRG